MIAYIVMRVSLYDEDYGSIGTNEEPSFVSFDKEFADSESERLTEFHRRAHELGQLLARSFELVERESVEIYSAPKWFHHQAKKYDTPEQAKERQLIKEKVKENNLAITRVQIKYANDIDAKENEILSSHTDDKELIKLAKEIRYLGYPTRFTVKEIEVKGKLPA